MRVEIAKIYPRPPIVSQSNTQVGQRTGQDRQNISSPANCNVWPQRQFDNSSIELKSWLGANELGKFAESLEENDIDFELLPRLSESAVFWMQLSPSTSLVRITNQRKPSSQGQPNAADSPSCPATCSAPRVVTEVRRRAHLRGSDSPRTRCFYDRTRLFAG
jgi:hypothetical protein